MKLRSLLNLREVDAKDPSNPDLVAIPYFREFQSKHGFKPLFKYLGVKGEEMVFVADIPNLGVLSMAIKDAQLIAKVCEKEAMFGVVCTTVGLEKYEIPVCKMKLKKDQTIELIDYDSKDKKNFGAAAIRFKSLLEHKTLGQIAELGQPGTPELPLKRASNSQLAGSSRIGILHGSYQDVVKLLGKPHYGKEEGDDKTQVEWQFLLGGGMVISIYDYKESAPPEQVTEWHIGGNKHEAIKQLERLISSTSLASKFKITA